MNITITVSQKDADRVAALGNKGWMSITEQEKKEYEHLIGLFGTAICMKILNKD